MHAALTALLEPKEQYQFPVYVGFSERYLSSLEQTYGFLAVTTHERLLVSRFSLLTIPMKQQAFALQTLQKLSEHGKSGIAPLFLQPENLWNGVAESGNAVTAAAGNAESLEYPK